MLNKQIKEKDKIMYDLGKENSIISGNLLQYKTDFSNLSASFNKERRKKKLDSEKETIFMTIWRLTLGRFRLNDTCVLQM